MIDHGACVSMFACSKQTHNSQRPFLLYRQQAKSLHLETSVICATTPNTYCTVCYLYYVKLTPGSSTAIALCPPGKVDVATTKNKNEEGLRIYEHLHDLYIS